MIEVRQSRVLNLASVLPAELEGKEIYIGVRVDEISGELLSKAGLPQDFVEGDTVVPNVVGPVSRFNAKGKELPQKHLPKETLYRDMEFTRSEWHGKDRVEVTDCVWIPYQRYPRELILPPGIRLTFMRSPDGTLMIVSGPFLNSEENKTIILHTINLFLEIFHVARIFEKNENPLVIPKLKHLNWNLLPPGIHPWDQIEKQLTQRLERQAPKALAAALRRFEMINELNPDFRAIGNGGYKGYVVFGFSDSNRYVLDSQNPNNAIYIFDENWERLSQLTKAEILRNDLQVNRIIHTKDWFNQLRRVINR
jgi:hypothetical protein